MSGADDFLNVVDEHSSCLKAIDHWIRSGVVTLVLQPVVALKAGIPDHLEALSRVDGSSAIDFIVELEERRSINVLDRYVIESVCEYLSTHPGSPKIFANVSGLSLSENGKFTAYVHKQLVFFGVSPSRLGLEITERVMVEDDLNTANFIRYMKKLGVTIAFDDFGVGQLRLANLDQVEPEIVKIDGSFVKRIVHSYRDRVKVKSLMTIAHAYGALVVAEHVENEEVLEILRELGVDYAQGYFTGKPIPMKE